MFHVVLQLLGERRRALVALGEHDGRLDDLPADRVRRAGDRALDDGRMLEHGGFHLKRPDAVAGALDDVVVAADKPVIPLAVAPRHVARIVVSAAELFLRHLRVFEIAGEQAGRRVVLHVHDRDRALVAVLADIAVAVDQLNVKERRRLARRTGNRLEPLEVRDQHGAFRLAEALAELEARQVVPLFKDLRIQRLARDAAVVDAGEIEFCHILLQHEAEHRRRRAERRDLILRDLFEQVQRHEFIHVVGENDRAADPLSVDLAPAELGPAGVRNAHVQLVFLHALPVLRRDDVAERVRKIVLHHLRHASCAGGEVHEHDVVPARRLIVGRALEHVGKPLELIVQREPALAVVDDHDLVLQGGDVALCGFDLLDDKRVVDADDRLHRSGVAAVNDVLFRELQRARDQDGAELMQRRRADPVFPAAAQDQHDDGSLADADASEKVRRAVRKLFDIGEGEDPLVVVVVAPDERLLFRLAVRPRVHDVEAEIEVFRHIHLVVCLKILVGIEFDTRQKSIE